MPTIPEVHLDFMFLGEEDVTDKKLTVLVVKERLSKMLSATVVPSKSTGEFAAQRVVAFMKEVGCDLIPLTMKSDNEPAIAALVADIGRIRASNGAQPMSVESSPAYSSASNGVVERGVQSVQGFVRVLRSAVEEKLGVQLHMGHAVWPWLIEYAAFLLNRGEVGHDGRTAYERTKGKQGKLPGATFAEKILWKRRPIGGGLGQIDRFMGRRYILRH